MRRLGVALTGVLVMGTVFAAGADGLTENGTPWAAPNDAASGTEAT